MKQFQEHLPGVVNLMVWGLILSQSACSLPFFVFQCIRLNLYERNENQLTTMELIMIIIIIIITIMI